MQSATHPIFFVRAWPVGVCRASATWARHRDVQPADADADPSATPAARVGRRKSGDSFTVNTSDSHSNFQHYGIVYSSCPHLPHSLSRAGQGPRGGARRRSREARFRALWWCRRRRPRCCMFPLLIFPHLVCRLRGVGGPTPVHGARATLARTPFSRRRVLRGLLFRCDDRCCCFPTKGAAGVERARLTDLLPVSVLPFLCYGSLHHRMP